MSNLLGLEWKLEIFVPHLLFFEGDLVVLPSSSFSQCLEEMLKRSNQLFYKRNSIKRCLLLSTVILSLFFVYMIGVASAEDSSNENISIEKNIDGLVINNDIAPSTALENYMVVMDAYKKNASNTTTLEGNKTIISKYGKGYRFNKNGWIYVHIEGEPYERGFQHGYLVAPEIGDILKSLKYLSYWNTGKDWEFFVEAGKKMFVPHLDQEFLDEIKGIADGVKAAGINATWEDILALNAYYELFYCWWPNEMEEIYAQVPKTERSHCSAFIATGNATQDGEIVMAHNQWEDYELAQFSNEILDILPAKGHHIFMQAYPGFIYSHTDFFVSDAGLMGSETAISLNRFDPEGIPDSFRARKAMQYADNLDRFAEIMIEGNNGGSADSWLLGDINSGEIMRLELGLKYSNITKANDGYFIGFNAPIDPRIRNLECTSTGYADIRRHQGARQVRFTQLIDQHYGNIDAEIAKTILSDHYDIYLNKINPGSRTIDGHYELDAMEFAAGLEGNLPFQPSGSVDGLVINSSMAKELSFIARWGNSCGMPFNATEFLRKHIQWSHLKGYLKDRPSQPWTTFRAGQNRN